jgi:hypothetical protein
MSNSAARSNTCAPCKSSQDLCIDCGIFGVGSGADCGQGSRGEQVGSRKQRHVDAVRHERLGQRTGVEFPRAVMPWRGRLEMGASNAIRRGEVIGGLSDMRHARSFKTLLVDKSHSACEIGFP